MCLFIMCLPLLCTCTRMHCQKTLARVLRGDTAERNFTVKHILLTSRLGGIAKVPMQHLATECGERVNHHCAKKQQNLKNMISESFWF